MVVSVEVHRPFGALFLALIRSPLVFSFILLPFVFIFLPAPHLILWSYHSLSLFSSHFLPSAPSVSHTESIVIDFISLSAPLPLSLISFLCVSLPSSSQGISCCRAWAEGDLLAGPGAATQDMGPASPPRSCLVLQPVDLPVCLSAGLSAHRWWTELPEQMDPTNREPVDPALHFTDSLYHISVILRVIFKINVL